MPHPVHSPHRGPERLRVLLPLHFNLVHLAGRCWYRVEDGDDDDDGDDDGENDDGNDDDDI
jgi:hypothetical protein